MSDRVVLMSTRRVCTDLLLDVDQILNGWLLTDGLRLFVRRKCRSGNSARRAVKTYRATGASARYIDVESANIDWRKMAVVP